MNSNLSLLILLMVLLMVIQKQLKMMHTILLLYHMAKELVAKQVALTDILGTGLFERAMQLKNNIPNDALGQFDEFQDLIRTKLGGIIA